MRNGNSTTLQLAQNGGCHFVDFSESKLFNQIPIFDLLLIEFCQFLNQQAFSIPFELVIPQQLKFRIQFGFGFSRHISVGKQALNYVKFND
jgi:hypothetical protein